MAGSGSWLAVRSVLLGDLCLLLAAALDYSSARRVRLEATRLPHGKLNLGAPNAISVRVRNLDGRRVAVRVRDDVPAEFDVDTPEEKLSVAGFREAKFTYRVTPPRRGRFEFGDLHLRVAGAWGLCYAERTVKAGEETHVYPDLRGAARLMLATTARDLANLGLRTMRRDGSGSEFARLREYIQGDPPRDIDWKATARRQQPTTRVYETERSQNVLLCVDAGRAMAARVEGENGATLSKLDCAVNAALFLAFVAVRNGDRVGLALFADGVKQFIRPAAGKGQYRRIVNALYRAEPTLAAVDYPALFRELSVRVPRRSLIVTFTDLFDDDQVHALTLPMRRLARRHVPLCVALRDPSLEQILQTRPAEPDLAFQQAVAVEVLEERERLRALVQQEGVQLVDTTPRTLTIDTVNRYLEIKRRGTL
ncbi:MAG: DUF58 domain-containing protein [Deltaproteobacteria bacterium]|nr:DUF58 domain-containing protein [Deltaproteobacteria bacterium]